MDDDVHWFTLPFVDEPLTSVTHVGNGKDADMNIEFANGRRLSLGVSHARIETGDGVVVEVSPYDDMTLTITYTGSGLSLRHGRISPGSYDERWDAAFLDKARAWVESNNGELGWVVHAELWLASTSAVGSHGVRHGGLNAVERPP